jgi:hypothetical protein
VSILVSEGPRKGFFYSLVIRHMIRTVRSYLVGLKASSRFGRASRLRDAGRKEEALAVAREALAILRTPVIVRTNPAEGSVLSCCTMLAEELAHELHQPGADYADISDSLMYLKLLPEEANVDDFRAWISYLESRARSGDASAV